MKIGFDGSRAFIKDKTGTENYSWQLLVNLAKIDTVTEYYVYLRPGQEKYLGRGLLKNASANTNYLMQNNLLPKSIKKHISRSNNIYENEFWNSESWPSNFKFKILNYNFLWTQLGLARATFVDPLDLLFIPAHTLPLISKSGLKTVVTVHDLGAEYLPGMHQLKQALYLKLITHYQLKHATKLIAVSQATASDLAKKVGISREKIEVIYEGVSRGLISTKTNIENNILNKFDIKSNEFFLSVGTIQPRKNLARIIESFALFLEVYEIPKDSDFKLVIAGKKGWDYEEIVALPKKLGVSSMVKFLGRVDDYELASLYKNARALIYPSLFEGFGLPILESFSHGCPILTSNVSSMPEISGNAAILVDPKNPKEIVEGMVKLYKDEDERKRLIQLGFKRVKDFSWEKTAKQTLALFKDIVN